MAKTATSPCTISSLAQRSQPMWMKIGLAEHADGSEAFIVLKADDVQRHPIASGALAPSADDHPPRDRAYRLVVLIRAVGRIA